MYGPGNVQIPIAANTPLPIPADGVYQVTVVAKLLDAFGNVVPGKNVSLSAGQGSQAVITPASAMTTVDNGAAVFTVTNLALQTLTFTATDTTDGIVLPETPSVQFIAPPADRAAFPPNPTRYSTTASASRRSPSR